MNEIPSTSMLFTFAPNSTLSTSLPLTIGLTYGLLILALAIQLLWLVLSQARNNYLVFSSKYSHMKTMDMVSSSQ